VINTNLPNPICTFSKLSQIIVQILEKKGSLCVFEPSLRGLWVTYAVHLELIGKPVVDFLFVLIDLFSLGVTAEALRANID